MTTLMIGKFMPYHLPVIEGLIECVTTLGGGKRTLKQVLSLGTTTAEHVPLPDGGVVTLVWISSTVDDYSYGDHVVILMPGMNNSSETGFVRGLGVEVEASANKNASAARVHVAIMDYRLTGTSNMEVYEGLKVPPHPACADGWRDWDCLFDYVKEQYEGCRVHVVGQSLGGGMTLKWIGVKGKDAGIVSAAAVCPPVDYRRVAGHLEDGFVSLVCNFIMTIPCKVNVCMSQAVRRALPSLWNAVMARTVREFENAVIVPLLNYENPEDYYEQNSPVKNVGNIRTPTVVIHTTDDPIVPPPEEGIFPDCVGTVRVDYGGHLGIWDIWGNRWGDKVVGEWVRHWVDKDERERGRRRKRREGRGRDRAGSDSSGGKSPERRVGRRPSMRGVAMGF